MAGDLVAIICLGVAGMWLAWGLRLPSILVLLSLGLLAGPVARTFTPGLLGHTVAISPNTLIAPGTLMELVAMAIGLILFEGGLTLRWREIAGVRGVVAMLVTVGAVVTWVLSTLAAEMLLGLPRPLAILFGSVLIVTGPTVIGPLLRFIRPTGKAGSVLKWEGIVIDPIGALVGVLVLEAIIRNHDAPVKQTIVESILVLFRQVAFTGLFGTLVGLAAGTLAILATAKRWVPDNLEIPFILVLVLGGFVGANTISNQAGLFASTAMGLMLANQRRVEVRHIVEFKEIISTLLIGMLFIVLAARMEVSALADLHWGMAAFVAVLVLVIRPASVLVSTSGSSLTPKERLFICGMAPRGIVAAGIASLFALRLEEAGVPGATRLISMVFAIVVATVFIYGLGSGPLARLLGLASPGQKGFLIVGGDTLGREIAAALHREGREVLLVDTNSDNIRQAKLDGLPTILGNALSTDVIEHISLSPIGHMLALTPNHEVNSMAAVQFARIFGRDHVYQLPEIPDPSLPFSVTTSDRSLAGRTLFGPTASFHHIARRIGRGATLGKTRLTDSFTYKHYTDRYGDHALPLFILRHGRIIPITVESKPTPKPGDTLVSLTTSPPTAEPSPKSATPAKPGSVGEAEPTTQLEASAKSEPPAVPAVQPNPPA